MIDILLECIKPYPVDGRSEWAREAGIGVDPYPKEWRHSLTKLLEEDDYAQGYTEQT